VGAPLELFERPDNRFVAGFLGSPRMNFIAAHAAARDGTGTRLQTGGGDLRVPLAVEGDCVLGVRPDDLQVVAAGQGLAARVDLVEHLGDLVIVYATLAGSGEPLAIKQLPGLAPPAMGATVGLLPDPARLYLFDADGRCLR
jgi:multiple sugar transport system ATP-binding protein